MSTNKSISYILCDKGIIVNLYKFHFPSFSFFLQPNKRIFHPPTFSPLQSNTQEKKPNIFYLPTFLLFQSNGLLTSHSINIIVQKKKKKTLKSPNPLKNLGCLLPGGPPNPIKREAIEVTSPLKPKREVTR